MRSRRLLLLSVLLGACAGAECRADPSPSCSYREERAEVPPDAGRELILEGASDLGLGQSHGCVMIDERDARCWGGNELNQLGIRAAPGPGEGWWYDDWRGRGRLTVGGTHSCVGTDDEVACWGNNAAGQLGSGNNESTGGVAGIDIGLTLSVGSMALGQAHGCVTDLATGSVICWGDNRAQQLGRGESATCCADLALVEGLPDLAVAEVSAGALHTCARVFDASQPLGSTTTEVWCWGDDRYGALGDGELGEMRSEPRRVQLDNVVDISAGAHHTCAVVLDENADSSVYCWGRGTSGELGNGSFEDSPTPQLVVDSGGLSQLSAGGWGLSAVAPDGSLTIEDGAGHTCARDFNRGFCWGDNRFGQLGNGTTDNSAIPVEVSGEHQFFGLAAGGGFSCGLTVGPDFFGDELLCWGRNDLGQLGRVGEDSTVPVSTTVLLE